MPNKVNPIPEGYSSISTSTGGTAVTVPFFRRQMDPPPKRCIHSRTQPTEEASEAT